MSERRDAFLARLDTARAELDAVIAAVSPEGWEATVDGAMRRVDLLAHIEWWERRGSYEIRTLLAGGTPEVSEESLDALNERVTTENRGRAAAEVRTAEAAAWAELRALAATLSEEQLYDPGAFPWLEGEPLKKMIKVESSAHWSDHLNHLR
jgi:hypothetical protein